MGEQTTQIRRSILVIGDAMVDRYWRGCVNRLSAEAPIPVVAITEMVDQPGGAANVEKNLRKLVDEDVTTAYSPTMPIKNRLMLGLNQIARWDQNDRCRMLHPDELPDLTQFEAIVVADYGKGTITDPLVEYIVDNRRADGLLFVNTKRDPISWLTRRDPQPIMFCNESEYSNFIDSYDQFELVVRTMGPHGAALVRYGDTFHIDGSRARKVESVNGAGDSFMSGFVYNYLTNLNPVKAFNYGHLSAAVSVEHPETHAPSRCQIKKLKSDLEIGDDYV